MGKPGTEIRHDLEALQSKKRYRNINHARLACLLERAELNVPPSWLEAPADLAALAAGKPAPFRFPKKAWWALVPSGIAAAAALLFMSGFFDAMRRVDSGMAGIVSGDVIMVRGGRGSALRAGDAVAGGDQVVTGANSTIDLRFGGLVSMRVLGGSRVAIRKAVLGLSPRSCDVLVSAGGCVLDVARIGPGESVSVRTPASVGTVRGTRFGVMVGADGTARYEVFEGTVRVQRLLPEDVRVPADAADIIGRDFREHALDLKGGQACAIAPGTAQFKSVSKENARSLAASLALPGPASAKLVLRDEMERLVRSSNGPGAKSGDFAGRNRAAEREAERERGKVQLMYIPALDCVVTVGDRRLTAIRGGDMLWSVPLDGAVLFAPVYEAAALYVPTAGGGVVKFDLVTGSVQWRIRVPGSEPGGVRLALGMSGLYCATSRGGLYKYDRGGGLLWSSSTGEGISAAPVISDRLVFASTVKGSLFGFDASTGSRAARVSISGIIVSIAARRDAIYIATDAGRLYCYDYDRDEMIWECRVNDTLAAEMSVGVDSIYLFGRSGSIYRISGEGERVWERNLGVPIVKRPSEDSSSFYIPSSDSFFVVDKITGNVTWSLLMPGITSGNVAVSRGHIFFETGNKKISSLKK